MTAHASKQEPWWEMYKPVLDPSYMALVKAEQTATEVRSFDLVGLHGLLQTEEYSRATTRSRLLPILKNDYELLAELRIKRQWHIFEKAQLPLMQAVIDEAVLHRRVGGPEVLREQLLHLAKLAKLPNVGIRVLPLIRPIDFYGDFGLNSFVLLTDDMRHGLYKEPGYFQSSTECMTDIRRYKMLFDHLWQESLSLEKSLALLKRMADELAREA